MATITASDYTVLMKIDEDNYKKWFDNETSKPNADKYFKPNLGFKRYLVREIESRLKK